MTEEVNMTTEMNAYQQRCISFLLPRAKSLHYLVPGLTAEVGEVNDVLAKAQRDHDGVVDRDALKKELGDVLFFVAALADYWNIPLSDVAHENTEKLTSRQLRGKIGGSGDNR